MTPLLLVTMTLPILTKEPERLTVGDTLNFTRNFSGYNPQAGDSVTYFFQTEDGSLPFNFTGTLAGNCWQFTVAASATGQWTAGKYIGQAKAQTTDNPPQVYTLWEGFITLEPSIKTPADMRSINRRILTMLQQMMLGQASASIMRSQVEGVVLERYSKRELQMLCDRYQTKVQMEDQQVRSREGKSDPHIRLSRFVPDGHRHGNNFNQMNEWGTNR